MKKVIYFLLSILKMPIIRSFFLIKILKIYIEVYYLGKVMSFQVNLLEKTLSFHKQ